MPPSHFIPTPSSPYQINFSSLHSISKFCNNGFLQSQLPWCLLTVRYRHRLWNFAQQGSLKCNAVMLLLLYLDGTPTGARHEKPFWASGWRSRQSLAPVEQSPPVLQQVPRRRCNFNIQPVQPLFHITGLTTERLHITSSSADLRSSVASLGCQRKWSDWHVQTVDWQWSDIRSGVFSMAYDSRLYFFINVVASKSTSCASTDLYVPQPLAGQEKKWYRFGIFCAHSSLGSRNHLLAYWGNLQLQWSSFWSQTSLQARNYWAWNAEHVVLFLVRFSAL